MNRIDGKVALVTGGTQGLGLAIARQFAKSGAAGILTCGRSSDRGLTAARKLWKETGVPTRFRDCDIRSVDDCRGVVEVADAHFGRLDILVNAAGNTHRGTLLNTPPDLFDDIFAVNVRGPFFLMQEVVKLMIRDDIKGSVVNIGSMSAHSGQPFISAYCASKGALATLTRNSGFALLHNRIRVNQLNIGWMASDGEDQIQRQYHGAGDDWREQAAGHLPNGRLLDPDEVAKAVTFLASDDSGLMTGSVVNFDQSVWGAYKGQAPVPDGPLTAD